MNVTVENLGPCKKLVRVEVDAQSVDAAFEKKTAEFHLKAKIPGFRPGKVPRERVAKIFAREIELEVRKKLLPESFNQVIKEKKLHIIGEPDVEEIQFGRGQPFQFAVTLETAPEFELPEYKGLPARVPRHSVTQNDLDRALTVLREKRATYHDVARPAQAGDFVVVNYRGNCEGKPILELAPNAPSLAERKNYWLHLAPDSFLPGFTEQLHGVVPGDKRTVTVTFPPNFELTALAGKMGVFEIDVLRVKERRLPELSEEFAKAYGAENLERLREGVREDLQKELHYKQGLSIRNQILKALLNRVTCELPESVVTAETRTVVRDIVRENQQRGLSKEAIEEKTNEIYSYASSSAKDRVKMAFLLGRIAAQEKLMATEEEVRQRILQLAKQNQMPPDKFAKELKEREGGIGEIEHQIMNEKVIDFLQLHAKVEEEASAGGA